MSWTLVSLDATKPQPWRNGGGVTRELLAWPTAAEWRVRLSVADVQAAGPFSRYEGVERFIAVLEGDGVVLRIGRSEHRMTRAEDPFRFDGGAQIDCAPVAGPTRDFNLMAPPGKARMQRLRGERMFATNRGALVAVYAHLLPAQVKVGEDTLEVPAKHLAWRYFEEESDGRVSGPDGFWVEANP